MLCLSRDLRAFSRSIPFFRGVASRCVFLWCPRRLPGPWLPRRRRRRRQTEPRASISPEGALALRQLFAEHGRQSPWGAGRLLFQACCRARSTGVRPPPLAPFGDIALGVRQSSKTQSSSVGLQDAPSRRFRAARPISGAGGLQIAAYDTNLKVWHREIPVTAVLSPLDPQKRCG